MATCANCGQGILFGGVKQGTMRFCNDQCYNAASHLHVGNEVPEDVLEAAVTAFHQGDCPYCGGPGPVDFHYSYCVMSFLIITRFQTVPKVSCSSCGTKAKLSNFFTTLFLGWWGFPFGLIFTPIYLCRNLFGMIFSQSTDTPSELLREFVKLQLAQNYDFSQIVAEKEDDEGGEDEYEEYEDEEDTPFPERDHPPSRF